ncbi:hypothetical protein ThvES_00013270 [Thiovulum sp. ES]|nr:hypothetical protein ThvES_00013270 [Thiovulum sp. ES]
MRIFLAVFLFSVSLFGKYVLKDELFMHPEFINKIEVLGNEVEVKTGVAVYVLILKTTNGESLSIVGKDELAKLPENSVILTFTETEQKVDIVAYDEVLELFDREQILSPYPWSGTILPILGEKIKSDLRNKYSVALFNGYADIVEQIASSKDVVLENGVGDANKIVINSLRLVFYGILIFALFFYFYKKFKRKK